MSLESCLAKLKAEGVIDAARAERFSAEYARLQRNYAKTMGDVAAADLASRDTLDALELQAVTDRRQKMLQIRTQQDVLGGLADHVEAGGRPDQYVMAKMDHHEAVPGVRNVDNQRVALWNLAWSRMGGFLDRYKRDLLGRVTNGAELSDVVRALRGEAVKGVEAREIAEAVADTFEYLRQLYNAAGGNIARLKNWGLPQTHDAITIARAGRDEWKAYIRPLLSPSEMIDRTTGRAFDHEALDEALDEVWSGIASQGMDTATPGAFSGAGKLANRRSDHRFLVFRDADAWLAYNERFGTGDAFDAITGHIDSMTRDIAAMQVLGPNPAATVRWLGDVLRQDALPRPEGGKPLPLGKRAAAGAKRLDDMWRYYTGELTMPAPENRQTARFFSGLRQWNTGSMLGSAYISALGSDPFFLRFAAKFNGLPTARVLGNYLASFNPANPAHRKAATQAGLVFNETTTRAERMWRDGAGMRFNVHELSSRLANGVLRATFLSPHTVAAKQGLGLSFMMDWADHAAKPFEALDPKAKLAFERYGIDGRTWDIVRSTPVHEQDGIKLIRPGDLARRTDVESKAGFDAALKLFEMIDSETRSGVPGQSLKAETAVATLGGSHSGMRRGTIGGELLHSATQFKTFSVIAIMVHMERALYGRGGMSRLEYAMTLPILLTIGGVAAFSLKSISLGQDPPPLEDWRTWAQGFAQGGGLGLAGDVMVAGLTGSESRSGSSIAGFATGPTIGSVLDPAINLTAGNLGEAARDAGNGREIDTNFGREAFRFGKSLIPGSNAWYARLAVNRLLLDQIEQIADPDYREAYRRMEKRAEDRGTEFWWGPGENGPERAPDPGNALGGGDELEMMGAYE